MSTLRSDVLNITTECSAVISCVTEFSIPTIPTNSKVLVSGIRRAGKSNTAALLTKSSESSLIPLVVFDLNKEVI